MTRERFARLLELLKDRGLSDAAYEEFMTAVKEGAFDPDLRQDILDTLRKEKADPRWTSERQEAVWEQVYGHVAGDFGKSLIPVMPAGRRIRIRRMIAAASLALLVSVGIYFYAVHRRAASRIASRNAVEDIPAPAVTHAVLTLANGRQIILDSMGPGSLAVQGNVHIMKPGNGQIVYKSAMLKAGSGKQAYNTLTNPRGSRVVAMTFSDGSRVWLNAGSSVTYPVVFAAGERSVELKGEGYFEIAKDPDRKFIVQAKGVRTEVLGTHFNVKAYGDETGIRVTLLEGRIRVGAGNRLSAVMSPGQQVQVNKAGQLTLLKNVNTDEVVAWKEGYFHFESAELPEILRELSRWYDLEIIYQGEVPRDKFFMIMSRESSLAAVLKALQAGGIRFRVEGRRLLVFSG